MVPKGGGGSMENSLRKPFLHRNFTNEIRTIYVRTIKNHTSKKKKKKKNEEVVPFQNGGQISDFISHHFDFGHNFKNYFPKRIFQWNLAQGEHE